MEHKETLVHHVFFWLKNPNNATDKSILLAGLETLTTIPNIKLIQIASPANTNRAVIENTYDVSWLLFFDNEKDEAVYQKHPLHLKFVEDCKHLWEKVVVYDSVGVTR